MSAVKELKRKFRFFRREIVRDVEEIEGICTGAINQRICSQLDLRCNKLNEVVDKINNIIEQILTKLDDADVENYKKEEEELLEESHFIKNIHVNAMSTVRNTQSAYRQKTNRESLLKSSCGEDGVTNTNPAAKLPKIAVPKFDGDFRKFKDFRGLYENLVHNESSIPEIQKLYYLKEALVGNAASVIRDISLSEDAYTEAWSRILDRYENNRLIIRTHLHDLFSIQKIKSDLELRNLLDRVDVALKGLKICGESPENWSTLICYFVSVRLDEKTFIDFENSICDNKKFPSYELLRDFLNVRAANIESRQFEVDINKKSSLWKRSFHITTKPDCFVCGKQHLLIDCVKFKNKSASERFDLIKSDRRCYQCLRRSHTSADCVAKLCKICNRKHHTLLHIDKSCRLNSPRGSETSEHIPSSSSVPVVISSNLSCANVLANEQSVLLPSAVVQFECNGVLGFARILLDSCSQPTLVSDAFIKKFALPVHRETTDFTVKGIADGNLSPQFTCKLEIRSRFSSFALKIIAHVVPKSALSYNISNLKFTSKLAPWGNINLADTAFNSKIINIPNVDLLIGAEYYEKCILNKSRNFENLTLRGTQFGWIITGSTQRCSKNDENITSTQSLLVPAYCGMSTTEIGSQIKRFWEIEDVTSSRLNWTPEESECVRHFETTHRRQSDGKFILDLPFKNDPCKLINNRKFALGNLYRFEKFLSENLKIVYAEFMREYEELGHMKETTSEDNNKVYYIPHHAVWRPQSTTTKVRVVFNASSKTENGLSLNDVLMKGPVIQPELFDILVRFRKHPVAFTADIEKMYRCIWVNPLHRQWQKILWRVPGRNEVGEYILNTVTYGTKPASFLATKCLEMLAKSREQEWPSVARSIKADFYMDDLLTGAETSADAIELQRRIHDTLKSAGFVLRKYQSNSAQLIEAIDSALLAGNPKLRIKDKETVSVLGLSWLPVVDSFCIQVQEKIAQLPFTLTKRILLSQISKIFDPLGFLSPVTIRAKIFLQQLWIAGTDWDDPIPDELASEFRKFNSELSCLENFKIFRPYTSLTSVITKELIGFADASEKAYAAVIFLRCVDRGGRVSSSLVCAKTRVAPIKELTMPKMELQAAFLLSKLLKRVSEILEISSVYAFSDSSVVLSWLVKNPDDLKVFVANRVKQIIQNVPLCNWNYVNTRENPADLATRGLSVAIFVESELWMQGPKALRAEAFRTDINRVIDRNCSIETKKRTLWCQFVCNDSRIIDRFSSYYRMLRVIARILRFIKTWKVRHEALSAATATESPEWLSTADLNAARTTVLRMAQAIMFPKELNCLHCKKEVANSSSLKRLVPFLDSNGIMRVSGRLRRAVVSYDNRHPILLSAKSHFVKIFVRYVHEKYFHANKTFLLAFFKAQFWCVGGLTNTVKSVISGCTICIRHKVVSHKQLMADLPKERVSVSRPFSYVGVDLAGPFDCQCTNHRSSKYYKIYVAIFVCFATKAVHLEIVSSLSSDAFLNCFQRLVSRRGLPRVVYSDNATNFVGTKNYLQNIFLKVRDYAAEEQIDWRMIPARSPHRGGLWEAAVKSAKYHLVRALKGSRFNYEDYNTIFVRIESILNSRPLCYRSLSTSAEVLTPGHFLIGNSLVSLPEDKSCTLPFVKRYLSVRNRVNSFWHCWSKDYLSQLQVRNKWFKKAKNLTIGSIILVKEDNLKPGQYRLGKVEEVFPDEMGNVRTVKVLTNGVSKVRPTSSLIPLPADEPDASSGGSNVNA